MPGVTRSPSSEESMDLEGGDPSAPVVSVSPSSVPVTEGVELKAAEKKRKQEEAIQLESVRNAEERDAVLRTQRDGAKAAEVKAGKGGPPKDVGPLPKQPKMDWAGKYSGGFSLADVIDAMFEGWGNIKENRRRLGEYRDQLKTYYRDMDKYKSGLMTQIKETKEFSIEQGRAIARLDQVNAGLAEQRSDIQSKIGDIDKQLKLAELMEKVLPKDEKGNPRAFKDREERDAAIDALKEGGFRSVFGASDGFKEMKQKMKEMDPEEFDPDKIASKRGELQESKKGLVEDIEGLSARIAANEQERNEMSAEIKKAERLATFNAKNYAPNMRGAALRGPGERGIFKWGIRKTEEEILADLKLPEMTSGVTAEQMKTLQGKLDALKASANALRDANEDTRQELKEQLKKDAGEFTAEYAAMRKFGKTTPEMREMKKAALGEMQSGKIQMREGVRYVKGIDEKIKEKDKKIVDARMEAHKMEVISRNQTSTEGKKEAEENFARATAEVARLEAEKVFLQRQRDDAIRKIESSGSLRDAHEIERDRKILKAGEDPSVREAEKLLAESEAKIAIAVGAADAKLVTEQEKLVETVKDKIDKLNTDVRELEAIDAALREQTALLAANKARIAEINDSLASGGSGLDAAEKDKLEKEKADLEDANKGLKGELHGLEEKRKGYQGIVESDLQDLEKDPNVQKIEVLEQTRDELNPLHAEASAVAAMKGAMKGAGELASNQEAVRQSMEERHDFNHSLDSRAERMQPAQLSSAPAGTVSTVHDPKAKRTPGPAILPLSRRVTASTPQPLRATVKTPVPIPDARATAPTTATTRLK